MVSKMCMNEVCWKNMWKLHVIVFLVQCTTSQNVLWTRSPERRESDVPLSRLWVLWNFWVPDWKQSLVCGSIQKNVSIYHLEAEQTFYNVHLVQSSVFVNENICVLTCGLDSLVYTASRIQVIICSRWVIRSIRSWNVDTLFNWIKKSDMFFFLQVPSTLLKVRQVCIRNYRTCKTCSQFKSVLKKILLSTPNIHSFGIIHSLCVNRESRGLVVN